MRWLDGITDAMDMNLGNGHETSWDGEGQRGLSCCSSWCCKESDTTGRLNNKQMARVNTDILGISELKRMGTGKFNSDDHYIYNCGQKSLRRNGVVLIVNKSPKCSTWVQSQKWQNDLCFPGKPFSITVIQDNATTTNAEEAERFYGDLQDLLELTPKKDVLFIIGDWNAKVGSQEIPGVTGIFGLGVQNEAGKRLTELCQNFLVIANSLFQQHKRWLYTWTSPDGHHQIDYILCSQRWRSSIQSAKTRPGADCGSDCELFIAKFRLKL